MAVAALALAGGVQVIDSSQLSREATQTSAERAAAQRDPFAEFSIAEVSPACECIYFREADPAVTIPPPRAILDGMSESWSLFRWFMMTGITYRKRKVLVWT